MTKNKITEEQVVRLLEEAESGSKTITDMPGAWDYEEHALRLEEEVRGLSVEETRRLRELERENVRLKRLLAESHLEIDAMKELASKNSWGPLPGARGQRS